MSEARVVHSETATFIDVKPGAAAHTVVLGPRKVIASYNSAGELCGITIEAGIPVGYVPDYRVIGAQRVVVEPITAEPIEDADS